MASIAALGTFLAGAGGTAATGTGLSTALTAAQIGLGIAGTAAQASAAREQGRQAQAQAEAEATAAEAAAQYEARKRTREGALLASRQRAIAAAQGGGADQSVLRLLGETEAETARAEAETLYQGRTQAAGARYRGQVARAQGQTTARGTILGGIGSTLGTAATAYDRFNQKQPTAATGSGNFRYG